MNKGASNFVEGVDLAFWVTIGISVVFFVAIVAVILFFIIKYNRKRHPKPEDVKDNYTLEIVWTIIPTIIFLLMFYFGFIGYTPMREVPSGALEIKVTGMMWSWFFEYENGKKSNVLIVPKDKPVRLNLYSPDILHSFYVPAFRVKEDVVPNVNNYMWFKAQLLGEYDILCAEYCGERHSYMISKVIVKDERDFLEWYTAKEDDEHMELKAVGFQVAQQYGCLGCHSSDGSKLFGPTFKGLFNTKRQVELESGETKTVVADEEYLKNSMIDPDFELVKGFSKGAMPSYKNRLTGEEIDEVIAYIKSRNE